MDGNGVIRVKASMMSNVSSSVARILVNELRRIVEQKFIISHDYVHTFSCLSRGQNGRLLLVL